MATTSRHTSTVTTVGVTIAGEIVWGGLNAEPPERPHYSPEQANCSHAYARGKCVPGRWHGGKHPFTTPTGNKDRKPSIPRYLSLRL